MARAALQLGVRELAEMAEISPSTLSRFETGKGGMNAATGKRLRQTLEAAGIEFIAENGGGAGVRFRERAGR